MEQDPKTYEDAMQLVYQLRDQLQALVSERDLAIGERDDARRTISSYQEMHRALSGSMGGQA